MSAAPEPRYTIEEFLARERVAPHKSEFYRGQIFAMAGGTPRHNTTGGNIFASLRGTPCRPYSSDQRIRIPANGLSTYPDLTLFKGLDALLELPTIACVLPLSEIYEDVTFGSEEDSSGLSVAR